MEKMDHFNFVFDAITELADDQLTDRTMPNSGLPALQSVISDASPLPREALFLGIAEDGLPVLLNLKDPIPGPILIAGDQASGKTGLLQMIARAVDLLHSPSEVQYGVITQYPDEWINFQNNQHNAGIFNMRDNATQELLQSLVTWAHNNKNEEQSILLLIDDLEVMTKLAQKAEQNLRWLLLRGPSRRVWPIITITASQAQSIEAWLDFFRTRLFGRICDSQDSLLITGHPDNSLNNLTAGSQFTMREGDNWLTFWTPVID